MNMATSAARRDTPARGEQTLLGSYSTYLEAQTVVDYLAHHRFEVDTTQIVGTDLRMVEQITGWLNWPRVLLAGAASGAWFGLFVGFIVQLLGTTEFVRAMTFGITWGMVFGVVFAAASYGLVAGRRDFTSRSATVPSRFEILVITTHADRARTVLAGATR